jgi:rare lipoprotein A
LTRAAILLPLALLLAACGTAPKVAPKIELPRKPSYYSDDGPPDSVPEDLARIPDAVPRDEPYHRYANRPYTVLGRTYAPAVNDDPMKERGLASWYGRKFHGQKTSIGETYDMFAMTAAHKTFPIPSYARVTNVKTGQSVVVRVNDRGPFHEDRVIDLSYAAAARIGIAGPGSGFVEVERVFAGRPVVAVAAAAAPPQPAIVETPLVTTDQGGLYLQLGAFSSAENAEAFRARIVRELPWISEPVQIASRDGINRVRLGPYKTREEAQAIADKVRASVDLAPVITPSRP